MRTIIFYHIVNDYLTSKNVTFEQIQNHPQASRFFSNGRLLRAAELHERFANIRAQQKHEQPNEQQTDARSDSQQFKQGARLLGKHFAVGDKAGLLTQAGVQQFDDLDDLRQQVKKLQFKHHPDRNPQGDADIAKAANAVADLLKREVFGEYLDALQHYRSPGPK